MRRMILIRTCAQLLFAALLITPAAGLLHAQSVPPPPKPVPDGPSLEQTLESLRQTLLSSAGLTITRTYPALGAGMPSWTSSAETSILGMSSEPDNCRVHIDLSYVGWTNTSDKGPPNRSSMLENLEAIDTVEAVTLQEVQDLLVAHRQERSGSKISDGYVIVIDELPVFDLGFRSKDAAMRAAELFRRASEICRSKPVRLNAAGGPSLSDTLLFIQQKLNDEASVSYEKQWQNGGNVRISERVANADIDTTSCQIRYKHYENEYYGAPGYQQPSTTVVWNGHLSFRRIRKLEVVAEQEFWDRLGGDAVTITPNVFRLVVTDGPNVIFRDAEMADRVAKAMNHVAELCGSSKTKEPF
jgi:hypothetical protein